MAYRTYRDNKEESINWDDDKKIFPRYDNRTFDEPYATPLRAFLSREEKIVEIFDIIEKDLRSIAFCRS